MKNAVLCPTPWGNRLCILKNFTTPVAGSWRGEVFVISVRAAPGVPTTIRPPGDPEGAPYPGVASAAGVAAALRPGRGRGCWACLPLPPGGGGCPAARGLPLPCHIPPGCCSVPFPCCHHRIICKYCCNYSVVSALKSVASKIWYSFPTISV